MIFVDSVIRSFGKIYAIDTSLRRGIKTGVTKTPVWVNQFERGKDALDSFDVRASHPQSKLFTGGLLRFHNCHDLTAIHDRNAV